MNDINIDFLGTMKADLLKLKRDGPANYKPRWRNTFLLFGEDTQKPLSPATHNADIHRLMDAGECNVICAATM